MTVRRVERARAADYAGSSASDGAPGSERPNAAGRLERRFATNDEEHLSDEELLALLIGCEHSRPSPMRAAQCLLDRCGSLREIGRLSVSELASCRGVGPAGAARILASFALTRRFASEAVTPGTPVRSSGDLFRYFHAKLRDRKREEFLAVLLDGKNRVIREVRVSLGSLTASIVHPREVFLPAIRESAGAMVLVHNHPSGDPRPSAEDLEVTRRLVRAGELLGIPVLDHVIIGESTYTSLLGSGSESGEPTTTSAGRRGGGASQAGDGIDSSDRRSE